MNDYDEDTRADLNEQLRVAIEKEAVTVATLAATIMGGGDQSAASSLQLALWLMQESRKQVRLEFARLAADRNPYPTLDPKE